MEGAGSDRAVAFEQSEEGTMSMRFAAPYPKRRRATHQLARNDLATMIRAPVAGIAGNRSHQSKRAGR
jgi:hypothetical protein